MKIKSLPLGNLLLPDNVFLAPMAGFTDYALRLSADGLGYGLMFTELVSAKGLFFGGEKTKELLKTGGKTPTAVQIFGADPYYMRWACESEDLRDFPIIDINMGCPVPKVYKNGEGSALLNDIALAGKIVKECVKSGKIITVKLRTGIKKGDDIAAEFCKAAEDSGAKLVTVHGRVRDAYYSGEPDYRAIERSKLAVSIPVIANGGVFTVKDADDMIERTGADGVMLARGAIKDPFLIQRLLGENVTSTVKEFALIHIDNLRREKGTEKCAVEFRKFVNYYFGDFTGAKAFRQRLTSCDTAEELEDIIRGI